MAEETITKEEIEEAKKKLASKKKEGEEQTETKKEEKTNEKEEKTEDRKERIGILNIYTTFNNTLMILTDMSGETIARFSGGQSTKQSRLKANPTVAMFVAQRIAEEARDNKITGFYVKIRAGTSENNPGPGAHAAIKSLTRAGFKIISIMETTKTPRGGPKKGGGRRGRRV
jgi:small subunit ribosomal protein S11